MPTPKPGETQNQWMGRCVPYVMQEGKKAEQAVAQCLSMWKQYEQREMNKLAKGHILKK